MGVLMDGFQRDDRGGIRFRTFDSDTFPGPAAGWWDAPDKVPPLIRGGQVVPDPAAPPVVVSQAEATISANLGTHEARPLGAPAKPGWPKGRPRGPRRVT
jgi:hypothetical protein